jgi:hypothetical protein
MRLVVALHLKLAQQKLRIETIYYGASLSRGCIGVARKTNICECTNVVFHEGD